MSGIYYGGFCDFRVCLRQWNKRKRSKVDALLFSSVEEGPAVTYSGDGDTEIFSALGEHDYPMPYQQQILR